MAVTQTAVSYYGISYPENTEKDFREIASHGCNTVILAITEFDMDFWFPSINPVIKKAKEAGLKVILDPWGIGKYFGGEQVSLFLQNNIHNRQVSAVTGEALPHACFNTNSFRDYFRRICLKLARETEADGFFLGRAALRAAKVLRVHHRLRLRRLDLPLSGLHEEIPRLLRL